MIYTPEYLARASRATVVITYPDGREHTATVLSEGPLAGDVRDAVASLPRAVRLGQILDSLRTAHAAAGRLWTL